MTEAEWLAATDPQPMVGYLRGDAVAAERKLRLFAVWSGFRLRGP